MNQERLSLRLIIATALVVAVLAVAIGFLAARLIVNREPSATERCYPYGGLAYVTEPYPGEEDVHCRDGHGWRLTE